MNPPRYAVGIDLGTTHCAVSELPLRTEDPEQPERRVTPIDQVTSPGEVEARSLLPSFLYLPHTSELTPDALRLPWGLPAGGAVGQVARRLGARNPARLVYSAKSWLSHAGVDRRAALLPTRAPEDLQKLSPLVATERYLEHLREAWDHRHPDAPLREQLVTLTVPASFDPVARELTAEAASNVGLLHMQLLEEPQAALYSWLQGSDGRWRKDLKEGDVILVVDVGGGTTDFSLVAVKQEEGSLALERVAVGDHILLGGDNMDLALAHLLKTRLETDGAPLDALQWLGLVQSAREAKEQLLLPGAPSSLPVAVTGRGSKLVAGVRRCELSQEDLRTSLVEGFLPDCNHDAAPAQRARAALTTLGLPYAQDAAITRHLAAFLQRHASSLGQSGMVRPTALLFNGGVFRSETLKERTVGIIQGWMQALGAPAPRELQGGDLDQAVAHGAAFHGLNGQRGGLRVRGGTAMSYYVGVESSAPAVPGLPPEMNAICVAPFGMEEGSQASMPPAALGLVVGEAVRFQFLASAVRRQDRAGTILERWSDQELDALPDIEILLPSDTHAPGDIVTVQPQARVSDVGTLILEAVSTEDGTRWKVELDTRANRT